MEHIRLQPDIMILGLRICEPVIVLTGLCIAGISLYAWVRLRRHLSKSLPLHFISWFFLLMGVSSLVGAIFSHAFQYWSSSWGKSITWTLIILSQWALGQAAIEHGRQLLFVGLAKTLTVLNGVAVPILLGLTLINQTIVGAEVHAALVLFGLLGPLEWFIYRRRCNAASPYLLWSIPVALLAVIPHVLQWSPGRWFSYFDIGHLIVCASLWLILLGGEQINVVEQLDTKGN